MSPVPLHAEDLTAQLSICKAFLTLEGRFRTKSQLTVSITVRLKPGLDERWADMTILARTLLAIGLLLMPSLFNAASAGPCSAAVGCGGVRGAPGAIAGAGLPVLAVGYGVYWLVRRPRTAQ